MRIEKAFEPYDQYVKASKGLDQSNNGYQRTDADLVIEIISSLYVNLLAPLIAFSRYAITSLAGRIAKIFQQTTLDVKISEVFQKFHKTQTISSIPAISLKQLSELNLSDQKKILNDIPLEQKKFITDCGGIDDFCEKMKKIDPNILDCVPIELCIRDPFLMKYVLLSKEEVAAFPLNELFLPIPRHHIQVLRAQLDRLPKIDHKDLPPLDDLSNLALSAFNSHLFSQEQIDELIKKYGENVINLISEKQIKDLFIDSEKMNNISPQLYEVLFDSLDDENVNKMRFSLLSHERVKEMMKTFGGQPRHLLSQEQRKHFYGHLKAADVDSKLYNSLFYNDLTATNQARFQLLSKEEAAEMMKTFGGQPRHLLSQEQKKHFYGHLKAADVDSKLYNSLFYNDLTATNQERFQLLSKEEAAEMMKKFGGEPRHLLSQEQKKHFYGNLKAVDVDSKLYNSLFYNDLTATNQERFQLLSKEEATEMMKTFGGEPRHLLSQEQRKHFYGHLKAADVDIKLYNSLFYNDSTITNQARFQLLSKEEATEMMKTFGGKPRHLLSQEQKKHFYGHLKAADVDIKLYNSLFYNDVTEMNQARFQLLSKEEATEMMKTFGGKPRHLLSQEQRKHFYGNLKAADVDRELYNSLFYNDFITTNQARFQLLSKEEQIAFQDKFMKS